MYILFVDFATVAQEQVDNCKQHLVASNVKRSVLALVWLVNVAALVDEVVCNLQLRLRTCPVEQRSILVIEGILESFLGDFLSDRFDV